MRYVDNECDANYCVSVYETKTNNLIKDFFFKLELHEGQALMVRYVCNNYPGYIDEYSYIRIFKVKRGYKAGVC